MSSELAAALTPNTDAYEEIVARMEARWALREQDDLMAAVTGEDMPYSDDLAEGMRFFLWIAAALFIVIALASVIANAAAGFALSGFLLLLWCAMVSAGKEISASADGAGNMYRNQRVGRSPEWAKQAEERKQVRDKIIQHENPYRLLENLDDPEYVRTLTEALRRDEHGWTMSD